MNSALTLTSCLPNLHLNIIIIIPSILKSSKKCPPLKFSDQTAYSCITSQMLTTYLALVLLLDVITQTNFSELY